MWKWEAERLCIEEVEKLTPAQAEEYIKLFHPCYVGNPAECLVNGFPDEYLPGLLESIALRILIAAQKGEIK